ncbi:hypothetical protein [Cetobacterium sp.]|uniref:hypothetical protein n=1 Tax=Cetobacterium sp. TaxID=2071632 RepID=UPI003F2B7A96
MAGILSNMKKTQIIKKDEKFVPAIQTSNFDYTGFEEQEIKNLVELEKRANYSGNLLKENIMELGEVFMEAQNIFSAKGNGSFGAWYENLGFKKDFIYMCIDRRKLALEYKNEEVYQLTDKNIKEIKKIKDPKIVGEILASENIKEAIKTLHEKTHVEEAVIVEDKNKKAVETKFFKLFNSFKNNQYNKKQLKIIEDVLDILGEELSLIKKS